jgi:hypothetical protein
MTPFKTVTNQPIILPIPIPPPTTPLKIRVHSFHFELELEGTSSIPQYYTIIPFIRPLLDDKNGAKLIAPSPLFSICFGYNNFVVSSNPNPLAF